MTGGRLLTLIVALAGVALVVVGLRTQQTRCVAELLKLESQWTELRREWWALQTRKARIRAPDRIHQRMEFIPVRGSAIDGRAGSQTTSRLVMRQP